MFSSSQYNTLLIIWWFNKTCRVIIVQIFPLAITVCGGLCDMWYYLLEERWWEILSRRVSLLCCSFGPCRPVHPNLRCLPLLPEETDTAHGPFILTVYDIFKGFCGRPVWAVQRTRGDSPLRSGSDGWCAEGGCSAGWGRWGCGCPHSYGTGNCNRPFLGSSHCTTDNKPSLNTLKGIVHPKI